METLGVLIAKDFDGSVSSLFGFKLITFVWDFLQGKHSPFEFIVEVYKVKDHSMDTYKYGQHKCTASVDGKEVELRFILLPITPQDVNDPYLKDRYRWANKATTYKNMLNRWRAAVSPDLRRGKLEPFHGDVQAYLISIYDEEPLTKPEDVVAILDVCSGPVIDSSQQLKSLTITNMRGLHSNILVGAFREVPPQATPEELAEFRFNLNDIKAIIEELKK